MKLVEQYQSIDSKASQAASGTKHMDNKQSKQTTIR
jgi:hypothetical protein